MDKKISIILCTYNESLFIEETINEIQNNIKNVEIILVDDSSTDGTIEKVKKINNPNLKIYSRKFRGLASAFLLGLINSSGDIIGWVDSNMKSAAEKLPEMIDQLNGNDVVLLSRYVEGGDDKREKLRSFASRFLNWIYQLTLSKEIKDYTSGMFVMKRDVLLKAIPNCFGHGEFFVEFIYKAHKRGVKIYELPFIQPSDLEGHIKRSKTASSLLHFIHLGFHYIGVVFHAHTRRN
jgi:glycosyltransferase involved in cell wall biosynthesis